MNSNYAFVDFQGFKDNSNRFIVKEIVVITKNIIFSEIIKSPKIGLNGKQWKQAKWLTEYYHGLDWHSGYICLIEMCDTIEPILSKKNIYLKGEEKIKWFKHIMELNNKKKNNNRVTNDYNIVNLESLGCQINLNRPHENNPKNYHICNKHRSLKEKKNPKCHCAMQNALILSKWYFDYTRQQQEK